MSGPGCRLETRRTRLYFIFFALLSQGADTIPSARTSWSTQGFFNDPVVVTNADTGMQLRRTTKPAGPLRE